LNIYAQRVEVKRDVQLVGISYEVLIMSIFEAAQADVAITEILLSGDPEYGWPGIVGIPHATCLKFRKIIQSAIEEDRRRIRFWLKHGTQEDIEREIGLLS
jgi:hypothetical protein